MVGGLASRELPEQWNVVSVGFSRPHGPAKGGAPRSAFEAVMSNGPNRIRTCDLVVISDALCQLSYEP